MYTPQEILDAARTIRPELPTLIAADAQTVDAQIADLLRRADAGEPVHNAILQLLAQHEQTRQWMDAYLAVDNQAKRLRVMRTYRQPGGDPDPIDAERYVCPVACDTVWWKQFAGEEIPDCETHKIRLVSEAEASC